MKNRFSIGEMSKLHNTSVKTLRYYDEIGLLVPIQIDENNGYRYYSTEQFEQLNTINYLIVFTIFKTAGAIYLFYLAYKAIKHRKEPIDINNQKPNDSKGLFQRGLLMNILNPKVAIFFLTFLPQFVNYKSGNVPLQMCILGLIFIIMTAIIFSLLGYSSGIFRNRLLKKPRFNKYMNITAAVIFIGLGLKLITTRI